MEPLQPREARVTLDWASFTSALQAYRQRIIMSDDDRENAKDEYLTVALTIDGQPFQGLIELVTFDDQAGATDVLLCVLEDGDNIPTKYVIVHRSTSSGEWVVEPGYHVAFGDNWAVAVHYLAFAPQPSDGQGVIPL